jgi:CheY-like chemotaxis protein
MEWLVCCTPLVSPLLTWESMRFLRRGHGVRRHVIHVADADWVEARRLADSLCQHGFRASHTSSGRDVLLQACSGGLGLAIVDVVLEDMSGHMLASQLKDIDPQIPILMTSADYRPELEIQARRMGMILYLHYPQDSVQGTNGLLRSCRSGMDQGGNLPGRPAGCGDRGPACYRPRAQDETCERLPCGGL